MKSNLMDFEKVKEALSILKRPGELFEVRILKGKTTISGYFTNLDTLEEAFKTVDLRGANIFYTLNTIKEECYAREQHDCFRVSKVTTSDKDIDYYSWLLVDLDPVRATGISSTKDELKEAYELSRRIVEYLRERDFPAPICALSGNGIHLLYKVGLQVNENNTRLIERCLKALDFLFSNEKVEIDKSVFNPSRISKLYGTTAQKGSSTKERPHRMARIISELQTVEQTKKEVLERLAEEYPEEPKSVSRNYNSNNSFDLDQWLSDYGIRINKISTWKDTTRYVLEECPFDSSHKAPDATLIKMPNGALCFKCFHNSCSGHDWREFRLKYEPDAYDDKRAEDELRIEEGWKRYKAFNRQREDITYEVEDSFDVKPAQMFETMSEILAKPKEERICIPTGLTDFDKKVGGLAKGEISLVSGLRGAAKSTWLSQVALNAINKGFNVMVYSGELKDTRFIQWMLQQAAGRDYVKKSTKYEDLYYCDHSVRGTIADWIGDKFRLYNNNYGSNFRAISQSLQEAIKTFQSDFVIIDNMSILDLSDISADKRIDKWDQQKLFVETLKNLSMICNCHIAFVAHPRKAMGFLRLDDVGGSGSLGNLVDNAFIVHRNNTDFEKGYKVFKGLKWVTECSNVIEVVKERESGMQDVFIPLWFEKKTKRLLNDPEELIVYGWDDDGFFPMKDDLPFKGD